MPEIIFRTPTPDDAVGMHQLFLARFQDSMPGYPDWCQRRRQWWLANGESEFGRKIENTRQYPDRYFSYVAVDAESDKLVGSAAANTSEDGLVTWWNGLRVAKLYEGKGIALRLEAGRHAWAAQQDRPVRVQVVEGNHRALRFFEGVGFQCIGVAPSSGELPLRRYTLELGSAVLAAARHTSDTGIQSPYVIKQVP